MFNRSGDIEGMSSRTNGKVFVFAKISLGESKSTLIWSKLNVLLMIRCQRAFGDSPRMIIQTFSFDSANSTKISELPTFNNTPFEYKNGCFVVSYRKCWSNLALGELMMKFSKPNQQLIPERSTTNVGECTLHFLI